MKSKVICRAPIGDGTLVPTLLISCLDPRFQCGMRKLQRVLGIKAIDPISIPGGIKAFIEEGEAQALVSDWLEFVCREHAIKNVLCVAHGTRCATYARDGITFEAEEEEQKFHEEKLRKAREFIQNLVPGISVRLVYARRIKNRRLVESIEVK